MVIVFWGAFRAVAPPHAITSVQRHAGGLEGGGNIGVCLKIGDLPIVLAILLGTVMMKQWIKRATLFSEPQEEIVQGSKGLHFSMACWNVNKAEQGLYSWTYWNHVFLEVSPKSTFTKCVSMKCKRQRRRHSPSEPAHETSFKHARLNTWNIKKFCSQIQDARAGMTNKDCVCVCNLDETWNLGVDRQMQQVFQITICPSGRRPTLKHDRSLCQCN